MSGKCPGNIRKKSRNVPGTFRKASRNLPLNFPDMSGKYHRNFPERSRTCLGTRRLEFLGVSCVLLRDPPPEPLEIGAGTPGKKSTKFYQNLHAGRRVMTKNWMGGKYVCPPQVSQPPRNVLETTCKFANIS